MGSGWPLPYLSEAITNRNEHGNSSKSACLHTHTFSQHGKLIIQLIKTGKDNKFYKRWSANGTINGWRIKLSKIREEWRPCRARCQRQTLYRSAPPAKTELWEMRLSSIKTQGVGPRATACVVCTKNQHWLSGSVRHLLSTHESHRPSFALNTLVGSWINNK